MLDYCSALKLSMYGGDAAMLEITFAQHLGCGESGFSRFWCLTFLSSCTLHTLNKQFSSCMMPGKLVVDQASSVLPSTQPLSNGRLLAILQRRRPLCEESFSSVGSIIGAQAGSSLLSFHSTLWQKQQTLEASRGNSSHYTELKSIPHGKDTRQQSSICDISGDDKNDSRRIIASVENNEQSNTKASALPQHAEAVHLSGHTHTSTESGAEVSFFNAASNVNFAGPAFFNVYYYGQNMGSVAGPLPRIPIVAAITLIDAIGRHHEIPISLAESYQTLMKAINLLLSGEKMEARVQRKYLEKGMFDLCADYDSKVVPINGDGEWSVVRPGPGTTLVLRVVLEQQPTSSRAYQCPRPGCGAWNALAPTSISRSIDCQGCESRFQVSVDDSHEVGADSAADIPSTETVLMRNFHIKRCYNIESHIISTDAHGNVLPSGWERQVDDTGAWLYVDHVAGTATEQPPGLEATYYQLPSGWEMRIPQKSRRAYFVDHNSKTTSWNPPESIDAVPSYFFDNVGNRLPDGWERARNDRGQEFYVDHNLKRRHGFLHPAPNINSLQARMSGGGRCYFVDHPHGYHRS